MPLYDSHRGADPMAVILLHDVTRERAQTRELEGFAGVVAHDLNSPLAGLMSWAEILDEQLDHIDEDATPARSSLVKIYRSADRMKQLLGDLLLLTRARSSELAAEQRLARRARRRMPRATRPTARPGCSPASSTARWATSGSTRRWSRRCSAT